MFPKENETPTRKASARERTVDLDERSPEVFGRTILVLAEEEVGASNAEFVLAQQPVVVGVDRLERGRGQRRIQAEDLEELAVFVLRDEAVVIRVDGVEEERQRTFDGRLQVRIVYQLLHRLHEGLLRYAASVTDVLQELVPDLKRQRFGSSRLRAKNSSYGSISREMAFSAL